MRMNRIDLARTELEKQQILLNKTIRANRFGTRPREVAKLPALPESEPELPRWKCTFERDSKL